ncbi:uncharacterized protein ACMZJ9_003144 [Mantella aurantiaca]
MGRMLVIVSLLLGGACAVQLSSSHLTLTSTQTLHDSYLISCPAVIPEERVTQVHWKERHPNGKYTMIAVLNTVWGNSTQLSYQAIVKLSKKDDTYMLEIAEAGKDVCCEVVTYPTGMVQESCLMVESDSGAGGGNIESALLGTLLVSGFFIFGCIVLICHLCWTKKRSRRFFNLRGANQDVWTREQRSRVPYTRTSPSVNLAYEPPIDADLLNNEAAQGTHLHGATPANQQAFEDPPTRASQCYKNPPSRNQWLSENSPMFDPPPYPHSSSVPPPRLNVIPEHCSTENTIYSNVIRHNRPRLKMHRLQNTHNEPGGDQRQPEMFPFASSNQSSTGNSFHNTSAPCMCGDTYCFPEETVPLKLSRLRVPRTPDSPFITNNPMYHSRPAWGPQPGNAHF